MIDTNLKKHLIENFKAYGNRQEIGIKPITLIFGPNNAGKSSLLKSLMYVHHLFKYSNVDLMEVKEGEETIDYGGINQIVNYKTEEGKFRVGQTIFFKEVIRNSLLELLSNRFSEFDQMDKGTSFFGTLKGDLKWEIEFDIENFSKPYITSIELEFTNLKASGSFLSGDVSKKININLPKKASLKLHQKNTEKPSVSLAQLSEYSEIIIAALTGKDVLKSGVGNLLHLKASDLKKIIDKAEVTIQPDQIFYVQSGGSFSEYNMDNNATDLIKNEVNDFIENLFIQPLKELYPQRAKTNTYFGPLRKIPERIVNSKSVESDAWYSIIEDNFEFEDQKHGELTTHRKILNDILTSKDLLDLNLEFVQETFKSNLDNHREIKNLALRNTLNGHILSLKDVGTGISQLLPIIVDLIAGFGDDDIIVEQPELHLHPGLQSKFGRLLSHTFRPYRNVIMETHSEHIIKSLQLEVTKYHATEGEQGISKDDVAILYVSNQNGEANIREMKLDESGSFTEPWPDDFFELSSDLTMERLKSRYKSMN